MHSAIHNWSTSRPFISFSILYFPPNSCLLTSGMSECVTQIIFHLFLLKTAALSLLHSWIIQLLLRRVERVNICGWRDHYFRSSTWRPQTCTLSSVCRRFPLMFSSSDLLTSLCFFFFFRFACFFCFFSRICVSLFRLVTGSSFNT